MPRYAGIEKRWRAALVVAGLGLSGLTAAVLAQPAAPGRPAGANKLPPGYLAPQVIDAIGLMSPAPLKGDSRYEADRRMFRATRAMQGSERWKLATRDVQLTPAAMMDDFSCAAGRHLSAETTPLLRDMMLRVLVDGQTADGTAKKYFRRLRPFLIDKGPVCQPEAELVSSFDYPSGHTVWGWSCAYVLAELLPDRAAPILLRGRAYGESRVICGAHNASAVEAGEHLAAATVAALHGSPAFRADLDRVRSEIGMAPVLSESQQTSCTAEARVLAQPLPQS